MGERSDSTKMLFAMTLIGTICALLIAITYEGTLPRIERLKAEALEKAIFKVLPGTSSTTTFSLIEENTFIKSSDGLKKVYAGYNANGKLTGIAIPAEGQGYADKIKVLYGYNPNKETVVGFYVLETKETPGLGDKIEKDINFLTNFKALDVSVNSQTNKLNNDVITVKTGQKQNDWEIDGITGATISSRAIGNIINTSANVWAPIIQKQISTIQNKKKKVDE